MSAQTVELRECVPALDGVEPRVLEALARAAIVRRYGPGNTLFRAGDTPTGLFFVLHGRVLVERVSAKRASMLHTESRGGVLGEIPIFGNQPYPATATALEPSRCALIPRDVIERLLATEPSFARFALLRLAARAGSFLRRIDELTASTVNARLASFVQARADETRGTPFTLGKSQAAVALELGTAREVLVRGLSALIAAGALRRAGRSRFVVADAAILRAIASAPSLSG